MRATGMCISSAISSGVGFAAELLGQLLLRAPELVHDFDHVHRDANGAGLVGNGAGDGLANPPDGIGGELVTAAIFEFLDAFHQADVAFLNQIEKGLAAVGVFLGDGNDEAQIGFGHVGFGLVRAIGSALQLVESLEKILAAACARIVPARGFWCVRLASAACCSPDLRLCFQFLDVAQAGFEFFVNVARHDDHVFQHLLLVEKLRETCPAASCRACASSCAAFFSAAAVAELSASPDTSHPRRHPARGPF